MNAAELIRQTKNGSVLTLDDDDLTDILGFCTTIREEKTCLAGWIRILAVDEHVLVQEQTTEGQILIRQLGSEQAAERLVEDRLATYERMWDGCGCKINYFRAVDDE